MKIYKFGGASIKDVPNIKNVCKVLKTIGYEDCLIVVSALGKTTNSLEIVVNNYLYDKSILSKSLDDVKKTHLDIIEELFPNTKHPIYNRIDELFDEITYFLQNNKSPNYNFIYDQIVSYGEILSTVILHYYLEDCGIVNIWTDARSLIKTDTSYRDANVNWEETKKQIQKQITSKDLHITQGFIGSDPNHFSITLGREGSDYSAAIFAYILNASSVTIWKDVQGVLNADPRYFEDTVLLEKISYQEAIELAFYGASVIHPKTLQPLQQKEIPLYVKSFINPLLPGTCVSKDTVLQPKIPCYIVKKNQLLISISSKDFSFIMEENISEIFKQLHLFNIKVNLIQSSAISFSVCAEDKFNHFKELRDILSNQFRVSYNENVSLYTIRHFDEHTSENFLEGKELLLKQVNRETLQVIIKDN